MQCKDRCYPSIVHGSSSSIKQASSSLPIKAIPALFNDSFLFLICAASTWPSPKSTRQSFCWIGNNSQIIFYNVATEQISFIVFKDVYQEEIIGQLSRMTILPDARLILLVQTSRRTAVLLLIDYARQSLLASVDLGSTSEVRPSDTLTQLTFTQNDNGDSFLIVAHPAVGLVSVICK